MRTASRGWRPGPDRAQGEATVEVEPLYSDESIVDTGGHLSPHMHAQPYMPVNGKGGEDLSGPYEVVEGWPAQIMDGWRLAGPSGCHVVSPDRVIGDDPSDSFAIG